MVVVISPMYPEMVLGLISTEPVADVSLYPIKACVGDYT